MPPLDGVCLRDVGLAWPQIIPIVKAAVDAAMMVGLPEARIPLADAVIYWRRRRNRTAVNLPQMPPCAT